MNKASAEDDLGFVAIQGQQSGQPGMIAVHIRYLVAIMQDDQPAYILSIQSPVMAKQVQQRDLKGQSIDSAF